jgi:hypothetical protein
LLHVKCKGAPGYVQLIYHENDSIEGLQEEAIFDQFIQVENEKTISFSTSHLPPQAIVHVLYVASDKQMMRRHVKATDGPLRIQANVEKYIFSVNGENFHHANPVLDGMVFPTMREFQHFMRMMKSDKIQGIQYIEDEGSSNQKEAQSTNPAGNQPLELSLRVTKTKESTNQEVEEPNEHDDAAMKMDGSKASSNQLESDLEFS